VRQVEDRVWEQLANRVASSTRSTSGITSPALRQALLAAERASGSGGVAAGCVNTARSHPCCPSVDRRTGLDGRTRGSRTSRSRAGCGRSRLCRRWTPGAGRRV